MAETTLKPCPFCGGESEFEQTGRYELTLRCVGVQASGLRGCGPKYVQKVLPNRHTLEWLAETMAKAWNQRAALSASPPPPSVPVGVTITDAMVRDAIRAHYEMKSMRAALEAALSTAVSKTEAVAWIVNCSHCGRVVDTREKQDGGDDFGCEVTSGQWTCSPDCWDAIVDPSATPPTEPALIAELQAKVERMTEALEPLAKLAGDYDGIPPSKYFGDIDFEMFFPGKTKVSLTVEHLRAARASLSDGRQR